MNKLISITTILLATCSMNVLSAPWPFTVESQIISSTNTFTQPDGSILQEIDPGMPYEVEWLPLTGGDFSFTFLDIVGFGTITEAYSSGTHTTIADSDIFSSAQTVDWTIGANQFGVHGVIDWSDTKTDFFVVWDIVNNGSLTEYIATDMDGDGLRGFKFVNGPFNGLNYALDVTLATPVPAAIWLFGSGLVALIGFARRKKA
ncbi:MAG: VPLPA-CTERM sorting domain-containing protein [Gammaproteobacteria bacterium]|nr:VPLPA-CTERM sorting domain-containing protein [Gammaproteobacteria bacterium]